MKLYSYPITCYWGNFVEVEILKASLGLLHCLLPSERGPQASFCQVWGRIMHWMLNSIRLHSTAHNHLKMMSLAVRTWDEPAGTAFAFPNLCPNTVETVVAHISLIGFSAHQFFQLMNYDGRLNFGQVICFLWGKSNPKTASESLSCPWFSSATQLALDVCLSAWFIFLPLKLAGCV